MCNLKRYVWFTRCVWQGEHGRMLKSPARSLREREPGISGGNTHFNYRRRTRLISTEDATPAGDVVATETNLWSPDQESALSTLDQFIWQARPGEDLRLGGLAGCGKSTVIAALKDRHPDKNIVYCAPTGRAASVISRKTGTQAYTLHSVLGYRKMKNDHVFGCDAGPSCVCAANTAFGRGENAGGVFADVLVVDEASMVSRTMHSEVMELGIPVVWAGDYGQLPPVGDNYSLVAEHLLDINLKTIHRQAEGDPIKTLAHHVRNGGVLEEGTWSENVKVIRKPGMRVALAADPARMVLCYRNKTRVRMNRQMRQRLRFPDGVPVVGDKVVCLRNIRRSGVYNGQSGTVEAIRDAGDYMYSMRVQMDSGVTYVGSAVKAQFDSSTLLANERGELWDFGYALTCHKAQGSEADEVVVLAETMRGTPEEKRQWLYTAVTRSISRLTICIP